MQDYHPVTRRRVILAVIFYIFIKITTPFSPDREEKRRKHPSLEKGGEMFVVIFYILFKIIITYSLFMSYKK
jgi:hypothetical protein